MWRIQRLLWKVLFHEDVLTKLLPIFFPSNHLEKNRKWDSGENISLIFKLVMPILKLSFGRKLCFKIKRKLKQEITF